MESVQKKEVTIERVSRAITAVLQSPNRSAERAALWLRLHDMRERIVNVPTGHKPQTMITRKTAHNFIGKKMKTQINNAGRVDYNYYNIIGGSDHVLYLQGIGHKCTGGISITEFVKEYNSGVTVIID